MGIDLNKNVIAVPSRTVNLLAAVAMCFLFLALSREAEGQDFKRLYKNAKDLFGEGKYNLAMEAFKPLIVYDRNNPYPEYASFYYAVSAYRQGYASVARDMFIQLRKLYPQWENSPEVNYWLAKLYFDQHEYFQGMLLLKEIADSSLQTDVADLKSHYFMAIDDPETLRMLLEEYPQDRTVAKALTALYARQASEPGYSNQFDSLVNAFQFDRSRFVIQQGPRSVKKDRYVIALLLPFLANTLEPTPAAKVNQQVLDLYNGMRMAADTLERKGVHLELRLYDTGSNDDNIPTILSKPELMDADVLVGPLFSHVQEVKEFSLRNEIVMFNPVSRNSDYFQGNPFAMLMQPSFETLGRRAAEWVASNVFNKNTIVYFGDTSRDSVQAFNFMLRAKELGVKIVLAEEHRKETAGTIITTLTTPTEFDEFKNARQYTIALDSIGVIYVASDNPLIYTKVNSSVTTRGDSIVVIGSESWVSSDNTAVNYENYERNRVTMAAPRYFSEGSSAYGLFRRAFISQHGVYPGPLSSVGYEFLLLTGQLLGAHGSYFVPEATRQTFVPGVIYQGFDYTGSQDNQYVPFIRFQNGQMVVTNNRK